ncbi:MAG: TAXI family TRAP transporter solute-binding subunit [Clostridia bacterium]|nr:TAXI family TRAP transporter solute-binding subunit [Clostridia bacterium]
MKKTSILFLALALVLCMAIPMTSSADVKIPRFMTVGTGATGGAYYPIGVALAEVLTNNLGTNATAQVTGGSLDNLRLINEGTCDIGVVQGNNMMDAYEGTGNYVGNPYKNINALFGGLSKGYFQVVVLENSPIQSMSDLIGKKVCMGPAGNGAIAVADLIWGKYGFSIDDVKASYVAYDDGISQLEDGNCDAVVIQVAIPASAIQQLAAGGKAFRLLSVDADKAEELCAEYGYFGYGPIATTVYDNMKEEANTMYISNMVSVRADLDEEIVYEMTKALFENIETIQNSHKAAKGLNLEGAVRVSIPMHPGAQRYFTEIGAM